MKRRDDARMNRKSDPRSDPMKAAAIYTSPIFLFSALLRAWQNAALFWALLITVIPVALYFLWRAPRLYGLAWVLSLAAFAFADVLRDTWERAPIAAALFALALFAGVYLQHRQARP